MIFVVLLSSFEVALPVIIFFAIVIGAGLETGVIQNAVLDWFSHWVFTPSFFLAVSPFFVLLLIFNIWLLGKLSCKVYLHSDKVVNILGIIVAVLLVANIVLQSLFLFIYFVPELFPGHYEWWWDNMESYGMRIWWGATFG